MRIRLATLLVVGVLAFALGGLGVALVVYFGMYNVSATEQHTQPVFQLLDYALRRSVKAHAGRAGVPADLDAPERVLRGAGLYGGHCLQCHGAPGVAPDPLAFGLLPMPSNLVGTAREWEAGEIFWVVKHGIKMSGMPAWTTRLSDQEIWDVVGFVRATVAMSPREYAALAARVGRHDHATDHGPAQASAADGRAAATAAQPAPHAHGDGGAASAGPADRAAPQGPAPAHGHAAAGDHAHAPASGGKPTPPPPPPSAAAFAATPAPSAVPAAPGDVRAGRRALGRYLCATCHYIPGVVGAKRHVGPPLAGMGTRATIAGVVPNTRENMVRFLLNPQAIDPLSAMPPLGVGEDDARDMAAFLATLDNPAAAK